MKTKEDKNQPVATELVDTAKADLPEWAEENFRSFLDAVPDAMLVVSDAGRIMIANAQAETLFRCCRHQLLGKRVETLIPERFRAQHPAHTKRFFSDPRMLPMGAGLESVGKLSPMECDPHLMKQVFTNLVSNAVKFTRSRQPALIEIGQDENGGQPVFWIRDNGVGFDMKYADKLFGVFQRLHLQEEFEGTGVGLANVQRIILKHGGRVWAKAEPGQGATFLFTLSNGSAGGKHHG